MPPRINRSCLTRPALPLDTLGGLCAVLVLGLGVPWPAGTQEQQGATPVVWSVRANGVTKVDRHVLLSGLVTQPTRCKNLLYQPFCWLSRSPAFAVRRHLDPIELRRDEIRVRLYYWRRGYRDVVVRARTTPSRGGVRVVFDIQENAPTVVDALAIEQRDTVLPPSTVAAAVQLRAGEPLDLIALDSSVTMLRDALWDRGYADATIVLDTAAVDNTRNAGPVTVTVAPGALTTVRNIDIAGIQTVSERTVRRLLRFSPGAIYRRSALLASQRDLYLSGMFSEVDLGALETPDSAKTVELRLREAPLRSLDLTAGFTTSEFLQAEGLFTRYNFLGGARRITLRATVANLLAPQLNGTGVFTDVTGGVGAAERDPFLQPTYSGSIDFVQPWFLAAGNQLGASLFAHRRTVPGVVTDRGMGATLGFTRELGDRANGTLGYTFEASTIRASDVYFCVSAGLCLPERVGVISRRHPLAPLAVVVRHDDTNDPFAPNRGMRARVEIEAASRVSGSDYEYARATLTASRYFRTSKTTVLASRVRLGVVRALPSTNRTLGIGSDTAALVIHPRELFFSGGSQSVRGYGENQLGPRVLTIDPIRLTGATGGGPCAPSQLADGSCDPNDPTIRAADFQPRPLGGSAIAEASVEYRFPLARASGLRGAVFVDGAVVGTRRFSDLLGATASITPGFGLRFDTPAGPVRLDMGIRPRLVEDLPVITQIADSSGGLRLVTLTTPRRFNQAEATGGSFRQVFSRLMLHLAIGPAF